MTKKRILVGGTALALTVGLGAGIAAGQTDTTPPNRPPDAGTMHDGDMGAMHAQAADEMRAQCETVHAQGGAMDHDQMMDGRMGSGMMNDGMMNGRTSAQS